MSKEIWDVANSRTVYRIDDNEIWDIANNRIAYHIDGNEIWDVAKGKMAYRIDGNEIWDTAESRTVYRIDGNEVWDVAKSRTAYTISSGNSSPDPSIDIGMVREIGNKGSNFILYRLFLNPFVDIFLKFRYTATRWEWWSTLLRMIILFFIIAFGGAILGSRNTESLLLVMMIIPLIPIPFVSIRRMRDIGRPWWWILVPVVGFVMCGFFPSKD